MKAVRIAKVNEPLQVQELQTRQSPIISLRF
jgi:hypothetical protein